MLLVELALEERQVDVELFYEGVVKCLDNNNKDDFDVGFLITHTLE